MNKVVKKWYISLVLIPSIVNLFTNNIKLFDLKNTVIFTLLFVVGILIYEILLLKKKLKQPKESDKKKINILLKKLGVNTFQRDIYEQDSWNGYSKSAIHNILDFLENATLLRFRTSDKMLNKYIREFVVELEAFSIYTSFHIYDGNDFYFMPTSNKDEFSKNREEETKEMNRLSTIAFKKFTILMDFLITRDFLEIPN